MKLTLFHTPLTRSMRPAWLLEELGLPYELKSMAYNAEYFDSAEYHRINPAGKVPALYDGEQLIVESTVIMEYILAKTDPSPLAVTPDEPDFGAYLQWLHMAESGLSHYLAVYLGQRSGLEPYGVSDEFEAYVKYQAEKVLGMLHTRLEGRDYIAADRFTAADISMGYSLFLASFLCQLELTDRVAAYMGRLHERPSWFKVLSIE